MIKIIMTIMLFIAISYTQPYVINDREVPGDYQNYLLNDNDSIFELSCDAELHHKYYIDTIQIIIFINKNTHTGLFTEYTNNGDFEESTLYYTNVSYTNNNIFIKGIARSKHHINYDLVINNNYVKIMSKSEDKFTITYKFIGKKIITNTTTKKYTDGD